MKKIVIVITLVFISARLFAMTAYADETGNENNPESMVTMELAEAGIDVFNPEGIRILMKDSTVYYTNSDIFFSPVSESGNPVSLEVSLSRDDGKSFSDYESTDGTYLYSPPSNEGEVEILKFRVTEREAGKENEVSVVRESRQYMIGRDSVGPDIVIDTSSDLRIPAGEVSCSLKCIDNVSKIASIKVNDGYEDIIDKDVSSELRSECEEEFVLSRREAVDGALLKITVCDIAGNKTEYESMYYIDATPPSVSLGGIERGAIIGEARVPVIEVRDEGKCEVYYEAVCERDNQCINVESFVAETDGDIVPSGDYSLDGTYRIYAYATDRAGNRSEAAMLAYRLDTRAPDITISGAENNEITREDVNLRVSVAEDNYSDAYVSISVYRKSKGSTEECNSEDYCPEGRESGRTISLNEDGDYLVKVAAGDLAGHLSNAELSFRIDREAPSVRFEGMNENLITNRAPEIVLKVSEPYYEGSRLKVILTQKDALGQYVELCSPEYELKSSESEYSVPVAREGEYKLRAEAMDAAGNKGECEISFTLDYTPPSLTSLDKYDRNYLKKFKLPDDFDESITDLTRVTTQSYLNSMDYDINNPVAEEGKYLLSIEAVDEAGNTSYKNVTFIIDSTRPKLIIDGLKSDGTVGVHEKVTLRLEESEDYFTQVTLGGKALTLAEDNKTATFAFADYGDYELIAEARDMAGNVLKQTVYMKCAMSSAEREDVRVIESAAQNKDEIKIVSESIDKSDSGGEKGFRPEVAISTAFAALTSIGGALFAGRRKLNFLKK